MNSKFLKTIAYAFSISIILLIVLSMADSDMEFVGIIKTCCLGVCGVVASIYFYLFLYCLIDNKNIDKMADIDDYDRLIPYIEKRKKQKLYLVPDRVKYYNYYLLLSYLMISDEEKCEEYFKLNEETSNFPVILYWKASYELVHGNKENVESYFEEFKSSPIILRYIDRYNNVLKCFESIAYYSKDDFAKAKETLEYVDEKRVHIPYAKKAIAMIKEVEIEPLEVIEENKSVIEEQ